MLRCGHARAAQRRAAIATRIRIRVAHGEQERERAALPRCAVDADLAAEQPRDLATDREAEARAAVLAAGRSIGLLEGLEDQSLLFLRDPDPGVLHGEGDHVHRLIQPAVGVAASALHLADR